MISKLSKALKVAKDLGTLEFTFGTTRESSEGLPFTLQHPEGLYTIWTASGFWFTAIYEVGSKNVDDNHEISKFGAIGKIIVWWKCQPHISKWRQARDSITSTSNEVLISKVMEE